LSVASGLTVDCGRGVSARVAPLLRSPEGVRTLPDPAATVTGGGSSVDAIWPDGLRLQLVAESQASGCRLSVHAHATRRLVVDAVGIRLDTNAATRILVDGYHSWDWAGLRDVTAPGRGWWGALLGTPGATPKLSISLAETPTLGALSLEWEGTGHLDALSTGEPRQLRDRTASSEPLRQVLGRGASLRSDAIRLAAMDPRGSAGVGLPALQPGDQLPRNRRAGWMSWNCLGGDVCGADVLDAVLTLVPDGGVALLDDGWMPWWGDWRERDDFDTSIAELAAAVRDSGRVLGLWLAPFLVDPRSEAATLHAGHVLRDATGEAIVDRRPASPQLVLDASRDAARAHLADLGARFAAAGVGVLKLDFLYAATLPAIRHRGWSGVRALREGMRSLVDAYRAQAPRGATVWACGGPAPPLVGLVDACRSGGDAVINVPNAGAEPPPPPWFVHGEATIRAQTRNFAARAWLWGSTVPPDVDAVTLGAVGYTAPLDDALVERWLELAARSGGPMLDSDEPTASTILPERMDALRKAQAAALGARPRPARPVDPLGGRPAPMDDAVFLAWPAELPASWDR
jgi:alpha-galactosidase